MDIDTSESFDLDWEALPENDRALVGSTSCKFGRIFEDTTLPRFKDLAADDRERGRPRLQKVNLNLYKYDDGNNKVILWGGIANTEPGVLGFQFLHFVILEEGIELASMLNIIDDGNDEAFKRYKEEGE